MATTSPQEFDHCSACGAKVAKATSMGDDGSCYYCGAELHDDCRAREGCDGNRGHHGPELAHCPDCDSEKAAVSLTSDMLHCRQCASQVKLTALGAELKKSPFCTVSNMVKNVRWNAYQPTNEDIDWSQFKLE